MNRAGMDAQVCSGASISTAEIKQRRSADRILNAAAEHDESGALSFGEAFARSQTRGASSGAGSCEASSHEPGADSADQAQMDHLVPGASVLDAHQLAHLQPVDAELPVDSTKPADLALTEANIVEQLPTLKVEASQIDAGPGAALEPAVVSLAPSLTALSQSMHREKHGSDIRLGAASAAALPETNASAKQIDLAAALQARADEVRGSAGLETKSAAALLAADRPSGLTSLHQFLRMPAPFAGGQTEVSGLTPFTATTTASAESLSPQWRGELSAQAANWGQKLAHILSDKIQLQLGQNIQRAQIRLDPPQLGAIELSIGMEAERTTVHLYASNAQLREAMQAGLEQLRLQLAQKLGTDIDVEVGSQQREQGDAEAEPQIAGQFVQPESDNTGDPGKDPLSWLNRMV